MAFKVGFRYLWYKFKTDKNYQLGFMAALLVLGAALVWSGVWYSLSNKITDDIVLVDEIKTLKTITEEEPESQQIARRTDGVLVDQGQENKYPLAVMIENLASEEVRPQFGLSKAQIVYELIVEAGITRFTAIFADNEELDQIGPVRSARPTFLEFVSEYDALYAHAGGSPEALAAIDGLGIKDCSALYGDSKYYWRDTSRFAPHNLFTSSEKLFYALRDKELLETEAEFDSWVFKDNEVGEENSQQDQFIKINFSSPSYEVEWKYNPNNNNYKRYNGGQKHKDALTDEIITAKNIIIQIVPSAISAGDKGRVNFDVNGEGPVYIFLDGQKIEGTWKKDNREDRTRFYNTSGEEISLNRGNIWVEILPQDQSFVDNVSA